MTISMAATRTSSRALREAVAEEIRALMARQNMSGLQLAAILGCSRAYLPRRLKGEVPFNLDDLERIAGVLGVTPLHLLGGVPRQPAPAETYVLSRATGGYEPDNQHSVEAKPQVKPSDGPTVHAPRTYLHSVPTGRAALRLVG